MISGKMLLSAGNFGFSRLKGIFRSGINYQNYEKIVSTAKRKTVGNIPHDMLQLIIKLHPDKKKEAILKAQNTYTQAAVILSDIEKLQKQAMNRYSTNIESCVKLLENIKLKNSEFFADKIYTEKMAELTLRAEQQMIDGLKELIPNIGNIKLSHIGMGSFGNAFRCEIFDTNGNKILSDRVIKTFHSDKDFSINIYEKMHAVLSKHSSENIEQFSRRKGISLSVEDIEKEKNLLKEMHNAQSQTSQRYKDSQYCMHGAYAEANSAEYIRYMSGHNIGEAQGLIIPDLANLSEHPYMVSKFVENKFTGTFTPPFNFGRLGLTCSDQNLQNTINGVCIDIGGVCPKTNNLMYKKRLSEIAEVRAITPDDILNELIAAQKSSVIGDKTASRILKRLQNTKFNEREDLVKKLERQAAETKDLILKKKILETLKEIQEKNLAGISSSSLTSQAGSSSDMKQFFELIM